METVIQPAGVPTVWEIQEGSAALLPHQPAASGGTPCELRCCSTDTTCHSHTLPLGRRSPAAPSTEAVPFCHCIQHCCCQTGQPLPHRHDQVQHRCRRHWRWHPGQPRRVCWSCEATSTPALPPCWVWPSFARWPCCKNIGRGLSSCCDRLLLRKGLLPPLLPQPYSTLLVCIDAMLSDWPPSIPDHLLLAAAFLRAPTQGLLPYEMAASQVRPLEGWCPPAIELNHNFARPVVVHQLCLANVACARCKAALARLHLLIGSLLGPRWCSVAAREQP